MVWHIHGCVLGKFDWICNLMVRFCSADVHDKDYLKSCCKTDAQRFQLQFEISKEKSENDLFMIGFVRWLCYVNGDGFRWIEICILLSSKLQIWWILQHQSEYCFHIWFWVMFFTLFPIAVCFIFLLFFY